MAKIKRQARRKKFNYDTNRKRTFKKSKKLPSLACRPLRKVWDYHKSATHNMALVGLSADPNRTLRVPLTKELIGPDAVDVMNPSFNKKKTGLRSEKCKQVVAALEKEANEPGVNSFSLSEASIRFCIFMMEKYNENYKAMARDPRNCYQDTPKQIKKKIDTFKKTPKQWAAYQAVKGKSEKDILQEVMDIT